MLNNHRNATNVFIRRGQVEAPETTTAAKATNATSLGGDEPQPTSENAVGAAAQPDIALAYQALLDDNEAFRTRLEREQARLLEAEKASLAQALLDSTDDLERALAATNSGTVTDERFRNLVQGVRLSLAVLYKRIADMGAERMSTTGERFDPAFAEAVGTVSVTDPAQHGIVIQELRPGYKVGERLLRPARVRVGNLTPK